MLAIKDIGPWSARFIMIRGLGRWNGFRMGKIGYMRILRIFTVHLSQPKQWQLNKVNFKATGRIISATQAKNSIDQVIFITGSALEKP